MSRYYDQWAPYVSVAERRDQAAREVAKLRKKGHSVAPVTVSGRAIASSFWGKSWCQNLESYRDYQHRLERGRSYVRNDAVLDLQLAPLEIKALVSGASVYQVTVSIAALPKADWQSICRDCAGGIDSLVELLRGRFSKPVMERLCRQEKGLFPRPSQIKFSCSCFDHASMCKHVAAALYGVAVRLDEKPELLFLLRAVDANDLLTDIDAGMKLSSKTPPSEKILEDGDLSALFGLEIGEADLPRASAEPVDPGSAKPVKAIANRPKVRKITGLAPEATDTRRPPPGKPTQKPAKHRGRGGKTGGEKPLATKSGLQGASTCHHSQPRERRN